MALLSHTRLIAPTQRHHLHPCPPSTPQQAPARTSHRSHSSSSTLQASAIQPIGACGARRFSPTLRTHQRPVSATAAAVISEQPAAAADTYDPDALSMFLGWLISNGVEGLGTEQSKLSMYESESGERGFLNTQPITAGEVLLRVPLRLALTSFEGDEDNALLYKDAPWSVRLSAKLLREVKQGQQAPRWPYLQVLPRQVPAPLETFSWEEMAQIQYTPGQAKLYSYQWLVSDAFSRCSSEALGGASEAEFQWAMSIIHSRTFGNAAKEGGVGVHMLVPLVDMFNHGGDETASGLLSDPQRQPTDNVRWDVVQAGEVWEMVVTATHDVEDSGNQLLLSYGERCSDDFFVHYGFVPEGNPHESVQLFEDLTAALNWHHEEYPTQVGAEATEQLYRTALAEAQEQQQQQQQQQRPAAKLLDGAAADLGPEQAVLLRAGGQVDAALMLAWGRVSGFDAVAAEDAVSRHCLAALKARCLGLLAGMPTTLLQDLAALWADATVKGDEDAAMKHLDLLNHYRQELQRQSLLPPLPSTTAAAATAASLSGSELPIEAFAWQTYLATSTPATGRQTEQQEGDGNAPSGPALGQLNPTQQLLHRYRLNKKMVLVDAVLATGVALAAASLSAKTNADSAV